MIAAAQDPTTSGNGDRGARWLRVFNWVCFLVALVALGWMVRSVGFARMGELFATLGWWFGVLLANALLVTSLDALALRRLMAPESRMVGFPRVFGAILAGQAINLVTPGGKLGEATKVTLLGRRAPRRRIISAVVLAAVVNFLISVLVVSVGVPITAWLFDLPGELRWMLYLATGITVALALGLVWLMRRGVLATFVSVMRRVHLISRARRQRWRDQLRPLDAQLRLGGPESTRGLRSGAALLVLSRAITWAELALLLGLLGYPDWRLWLGVVSSGMVVAWAAQVVPMGIGLAEGGAYLVFHLLGAPPAIGVGIVLVGRVRQVAMAALGLGCMLILQAIDRPRRARALRPAAVT